MAEEIKAASADQLKMVDRICLRVLTQVEGCDAAARSQASYIATHKIKSMAGIPPWLVDMLIQLALELIKKWMDEREKAPGVATQAAGGQSTPVKS